MNPLQSETDYAFQENNTNTVVSVFSPPCNPFIYSQFTSVPLHIYVRLITVPGSQQSLLARLSAAMLHQNAAHQQRAAGSQLSQRSSHAMLLPVTTQHANRRTLHAAGSLTTGGSPLVTATWQGAGLIKRVWVYVVSYTYHLCSCRLSAPACRPDSCTRGVSCQCAAAAAAATGPGAPGGQAVTCQQVSGQ